MTYQEAQRAAGEELAKGNKSYRIDDRRIRLMFDPFRKHALNLNALANGMEIAVDKEMKSERMKTELITNVSHDLRTPLTSIIGYGELLKDEKLSPDGRENLEKLYALAYKEMEDNRERIDELFGNKYS